MPNSHRPPDTTRRSCLCRVWCAGVNWTIALNASRLQIFYRRQSRLVGNPTDTDTTQTRQFCRVWSGGMNWVLAKFHWTGPTGPDQTKSADFVGDETRVTAGSAGSARVSDKVRGLCPVGSGRVGSGRVGPVSWNLAIRDEQSLRVSTRRVQINDSPASRTVISRDTCGPRLQRPAR